jgi:hypothetical protein
MQRLHHAPPALLFAPRSSACREEGRIEQGSERKAAEAGGGSAQEGAAGLRDSEFVEGMDGQ